MLYTDYTNVVLTPEANVSTISAAANGTVTITGTGDFAALISMLPRYDNTGREYTYTVKETSTEIIATNGDRYVFDHLSYSTEEDATSGERIKTATITNVMPVPGSSITFEVYKAWADDNDVHHRVPVEVVITYTDPNDSAKNKDFDPIRLTASNSWHQRVSYSVENTVTADPRLNPANYSAREVSYDDRPAQNRWMEVHGTSAETPEHLYDVTVAQNGHTFTITNKRVGTLKVDVFKTWAVGDMSGLAARFQLYQNGAPASTPNSIQTLVQTSATDKITFASLPKYDNNGAVIAYSVRELDLQYASDDATRVSFGNSGVAMLQGNRIVSSFTEDEYGFGPDHHTGDTITYRFTNLRRERASLYVNKVWRDAGTGASRPDIKLSLSYRLAGSGAAPTPALADRLWNTKLNNWYWLCGFGMMDKYDDEGRAYEYLVSETIMQPDSLYRPSYYNGSAQPTASGTNAASTFASDPDSAQYARAGYMTSGQVDAGTIINTLADSMIFKGKKQWRNIPAWFDTKDLPTIHVQLYRSAAGVSEEIVGNRIALAQGQTDFQIPDAAASAAGERLDVYTKFGLPYTYVVREVDENGYPLIIDGYSVSVNDGVITNTYVVATTVPTVKVTVNKTWDMTNAQFLPTTGEEKYPAVTFTLSREWKKDAGATPHSEVVARYTMDSASFTSNTSINTTPIIFPDVIPNAKPLPYYAPDGQPYQYFVTETSAKGYTAAVDGYATPPAGLKVPIALTTADSGNSYTGAVKFTNTYAPAAEPYIVATKIWADSGNLYGTRPSFSSMNKPLAPLEFQLRVRVKGDSGVGSVVGHVIQHWEEGTNNRWRCTYMADVFSTQLYKNDTLGRELEYYVTEILSAPYNGESYYPDSLRETDSLSITNRLNSVNLYVDKEWKSETESGNIEDVSAAELTNLLALGGITTLTFQVYQSADGSHWTHLTSLDKSIAAADLVTAHRQGKYLTIATGLPRYVQGDTTKPYQYKSVEATAASNTFYTVSNPTGAASGSDNKISTVTNTFLSRKLYFAKDWEDDVNRAGVRPSSLTITVVRTPSGGGAAEQTTVTLSKSTRSDDPKIRTDAARHGLLSDGTRWLGELTVPRDGTYSAFETLPASSVYAKTAGDPVHDQSLPVGSATYDWFSFTNSYTPPKITIHATKTWGGDGKDAAYGDRPASVEFKLQYKLTGAAAWKDFTVSDTDFPAAAQLSQTLRPTGTETWSSPGVKATWADLPAYQKKTESNTPSTGIAYSYRVIEVRNPVLIGYTVADSAEVQAKSVAATSSQAATVQVTNTPKTTTLKVVKTWADSNSRGLRPSAVTFTLQRTTSATGTGATDVTTVDGNGIVTPVTMVLHPSGNGTDTLTFTGLPTHSAAGELYYYSATEKSPPENYIKTAESTTGTPASGNRTTHITNTLRVMGFYAVKNWTHQAGAALSTAELSMINDLGGLPTITFTVERRVLSTDAWAPVSGATLSVTGDEHITKLTSADPAVRTAPYLVEENLPRYVPGTQTEYQYRIVETVSDATGITLDSSPSSVTADTGTQFAKLTTTFTNDIATRTLYFVKDWADDLDRDDLRPDDLDLTITRSSNGKSVSLTLNAAKTDTSDPRKSQSAHKPLTDGSRWLGELLVPASGGYLATEASITGYTPKTGDPAHEHTDAVQPSDVYDWWGFTNQYTPRTIKLTATKSWTGSGKDADYSDRPSSITLLLQRRLTANATDPWDDLTSLTQTVTPTAGGVWSAVWEDLPAYKAKTHSSDPTQAYSYRVEEVPHAGYTTTYGPSGSTTPLSVDAAVGATDKTLSLSNALSTVSLKVTKSWTDDPSVIARPLSIQVKLQRRVAGATPANAWTDVTTGASRTPVTATLTAAGSWEDATTFVGLPKTDASGAAYEYRAVEVGSNGYYRQTVMVSKNGDDFSCVINNDLQTISVYVNKAWTDQSGDPLSLDLMRQIHALGGLPDITFRVERRSGTDDWAEVSGAALTITGAEIISKLSSADVNERNKPYLVAEKLPKYATGSVTDTQTEYEYRVREDDAAGVTVDYGTTASAPSTGSGRVSTFTVPITNKVSLRKLYFVKNWDDFANTDNSRPASLVITVTRDPNTPSVAADDKTHTVTLSATSVSTDPRAQLAGATAEHGPLSPDDGTRWFGELIVPSDGNYTAVETVPADYTQKPGSPAHEHTDATSSASAYDWWSFANSRARKTVDITAKKAWAQDGHAVAWGDRPVSVLVKLQRKLTDEPDNAWADLTDSPAMSDTPIGYQMLQEIKPGQNESWADVSASWTGLPAYRTKVTSTDERKAYSYRVVEASTTGYTASIVYDGDATLSSVSGGTVTSGVNAVLTNTMNTVSLRVTILWEDHSNAASRRPSSVTVQLQRRPAGSTSEGDWANVSTTDLTSAPVSTIIQPDANGLWRDDLTFATLPEADANGQRYEYRVVQTNLDGHYGSSLSLTTLPQTTAETIVNRLTQQIEIDNVTRNAATGATNAGGYVGVATANPTQRDMDPYQIDKLSVAWRPETAWKHDPDFQVLYQESASSAWQTIAANAGDLARLRARFPNARVTDNGATRTLTLANALAEMPYQTRVLVAFKPTLAVENTTRSNRGGQVKISTWSSVADGMSDRYSAVTAYGKANKSWMVDMSHLQISAPTGLPDSYAHNASAVTISPDRDGYFTASVPVTLAGGAETLTVSGRVAVLARDVYLNPVEVSVTLSQLEAPLDIGIPFKAATVPGPIPTTGDPIVWLMLTLLASAVSMTAISIVKRRRKRAASTFDDRT